jgi:signal transduction histidine kinase
MNKLLGTIGSFFSLTAEERTIYRSELNPENARRAFYFTLIAIPVSIIHMILFAPKLEASDMVESQWARSVVYSHMSIFIVSTISAVLLYVSFYRDRKITKTAKIVTNALIFSLLIWGCSLAAFDQRVTTAITPFLNASLLVGLFFRMRPTYSLLYYSLSFLVFCIAIAQLQPNEEILISNQVNGLSIIVICLSLSMILWHSNLTRIMQREQIIRQNKALFESNAEKDKFFSIVAHDLKSPFVSILGFSDLMIEQVAEKDFAEVGKCAQIIRQSSKSAMDLLMNLMDWSNAQTGRMEFHPERFELNELTREAEYLFAGPVLHKNLTLRMDIPENTYVFADMNMIRTILRNLLSNAIKFTKPEGQVVVTVQPSEQELVLSVSDNGVGISKDSFSRLFRVDDNYSTLGTQNEKGTGLGLFLCKELMDRHGGRIWGESEPGKGSTFHITLKLDSEERTTSI